MDTAGYSYVTGQTASADFPVANALQGKRPTTGTNTNAFVTKLDANGGLRFSTYLGGTGSDLGNAIVVTAAGNVIAAGQTSSLNFPVANAIQPTFTGGNVANTGATKGFVTKYTPDGSALVYSTYFGGSWKDSIAGLAVDPAGNTYITGKTSSTDYPTLYAARPNLNSVAGYKSTNGGVSWSAIRGGLSTGYVQWLVVDPANSLNVYGATRDRGIFASSDGGNTWQSLVSIPGVLAGTGVRTWMLAMTKTTPTSTLYAATVSNGDYDLISSTDGGQSWKFPKNPLPAAHIYAVAADPTNPKNAYYTASNGTPPRLYRSTDAGDNGTSTGANIVGFPEMLVVDPTNSAHIYVAALDGVYLSNDTGVTWKKANTGFSNSATWSIAQDPATPSTLYAGTPGSVYRSTDSGDSWTLALTSAGNTFVALAIDPNNHAVYAGGGAVMFKSTDGGGELGGDGSGTSSAEHQHHCPGPQQPIDSVRGAAGGFRYVRDEAGPLRGSAVFDVSGRKRAARRGGDCSRCGGERVSDGIGLLGRLSAGEQSGAGLQRCVQQRRGGEDRSLGDSGIFDGVDGTGELPGRGDCGGCGR